MQQAHNLSSSGSNPDGPTKLYMKKIIFLAALLSANSVKDAQVCKRGEEELCANLTQAVVTISETSVHRVHRKCGFRAKACATLHLSESSKECQIYIYDAEDTPTLLHELNHCRGWDHGIKYNKPWRVMPQVERFRTLLKKKNARSPH